jgi:cytochrome c oxidase assembly factor CtaG
MTQAHDTGTAGGSPAAQLTTIRWQRKRRWLALAAAMLAAASLLPPAATYARQYVFAESLQFAVFAMVAPALLVLAAPWRLTGLAARPTASPTASPRRHRPFVEAAVALALFAGASIAWRLPGAVDALARHPWLTVAELASLLAAGTVLWLELVRSPPLQPRLTHLQRGVVAALAMWTIWVLAYILGFSGVAWYHAYGHAALGTVADQEIATATLWAVAAVCFAPVIFFSAMTWLKDTEDPDHELRAIVRGAAGSGARRSAVKGWGRPAR